jgi:hypothetical protein
VDFFHLNCQLGPARVGRLNKQPCAWIEVTLIMVLGEGDGSCGADDRERIDAEHSGSSSLFSHRVWVGFLLGPIRVFWLESQVGEAIATLCEAPFLSLQLYWLPVWSQEY